MNSTQTNQYGQRVTWRMELPNGDMPHLNLYIRGLLKTQDLEAWKADPAGFDAWVKKCVCDYVQQIQFGIVTYAQTAPASTPSVRFDESQSSVCGDNY